jgi:L-fuconolactonase
MEIVDAYTHCGIHKYHPIEQLTDVMKAAGVSRAVLVQHLGEFNNSYIQEIVANDPDHFAGVCLVDHEHPDCVVQLERWTESGRFKGVRLTTEVCTAAPHLLRSAASLGLIIVLYAPNGIIGSVSLLAEFLEERPDARIVLTHLGNPNVSVESSLSADGKIFRLAEYPGTYFQVSGMKMFCASPHEPLHPLIEEATKHFGTSRLCWGSNYPVVGDERDYINDLNLLLDGQLPVPAESLAEIVGENARRLWFPESREPHQYIERM